MTSFAFQLTSGIQCDLNAGSDPHLLTPVMQSIGGIRTLPKGPIAFQLSISYIWNHANFQSVDPSGQVLIPKDVIVSLDRL